MRLRDLTENRTTGVKYTTRHKLLYHMTDGDGLSHMVVNNALVAKSQNYISTTWDKTMTNIVGRHFAIFKFVLDGPSLAKTYGVFNYDHKATIVGSGERASLNEREVGVNTPHIRPLLPFLKGVSLMGNPFGTKILQGLLYKNKDGLPRGAEAITKIIDEWKIPVLVGSVDLRPLNAQETALIRDTHELSTKGYSYKQALFLLSDKYNIIDHDRTPLDARLIARMDLCDDLTKMYNAYFMDRRYDNVDPGYVESLFQRSLKLMKVNNNEGTTLMHAAKDRGLFHPAVPAVEWLGLMKPIMRGDIDEAIDLMDYMKNELERSEPIRKVLRFSPVHYGSMISGISDNH